MGGFRIAPASLPGYPGDRSRPRATLSQRLKRVFDFDIEICTECGGAVKVVACIEDPVVIKQSLDHLKRKAETSRSGM